MLSYHPSQGSEGLFPLGFLSQILHEFHFCHMCSTSHVTKTLHDLITLVTNYEDPRFANFSSLFLLSLL